MLHPAVERWFRSRYDDFTGRNTLILAPTGSGKTLAAFLPVLSELTRMAGDGDGLPNATCAVSTFPR